jgi:hypothetical protein
MPLSLTRSTSDGPRNRPAYGTLALQEIGGEGHCHLPAQAHAKPIAALQVEKGRNDVQVINPC